jgi:hypothetical protein
MAATISSSSPAFQNWRDDQSQSHQRSVEGWPVDGSRPSRALVQMK